MLSAYRKETLLYDMFLWQNYYTNCFVYGRQMVKFCLIVYFRISDFRPIQKIGELYAIREH